MSFGYIVAGEDARGRYVALCAPLDSYDAVEQMHQLIERHTGKLAWVSRAEDPKRWQILRGEKVAEKRIYVVNVNQQDGDAGRGVPDAVKRRLVRAGNPAQAIRHVAKGMISAKPAKADELVTEEMRALKVEEAGDE